MSSATPRRSTSSPESRPAIPSIASDTGGGGGASSASGWRRTTARWVDAGVEPGSQVPTMPPPPQATAQHPTAVSKVAKRTTLMSAPYAAAPTVSPQPWARRRGALCNAAPVNRTEIEITLNRGRADALEMVAAMDEHELRAPRTPSEHDPDSWWSWADHFIHISLIERIFNAMIRRHLAGEQGMDRSMVDESGKALRPLGDIMAYVHELTESWKVKHEGKPLGELVRISSGIRAETLHLLSEIDDEQLQPNIPGPPWPDGPVGGIMAAHAGHWKMHRNWAHEGAPSEAVSS